MDKNVVDSAIREFMKNNELQVKEGESADGRKYAMAVMTKEALTICFFLLTAVTMLSINSACTNLFKAFCLLLKNTMYANAMIKTNGSRYR